MIAVESIVRNVKIQPRFRNDEFDVLLQYALRGVKEVCGIRGLPKTIFLELNDNNVARLPDDYLSYSKVGICANDQFYTLGYNSKLCKMEADCPSPVNTNSDTRGFYFNNLFLPNNGAYGRVFGFGLGTNIFGEYNVDEKNGQIQFSDNIQGDPILEYVSSSTDITNGTVMVDPLAEEALIAWVEYIALKGRGTSNLGEVRDAYQNYLLVRDNYVARKFSFTFDEFRQAVDHGFMQSPKH